MKELSAGALDLHENIAIDRHQPASYGEPHRHR